mgnify:CR=1 FL=1
MKNTKAKSAPAIVWRKGNRPDEWIVEIGGKPIFEITDDGVLFFKAGDSILLGSYSSPRSAKRGTERFAKRMREIFAEDGK